MLKNLIVHLVSSDKERFHLQFHIRQTDLAQRWANLVKKDLPYGIRENERFKGFDEDLQTRIDQGVRKVTSLIQHLKPLHPEIDFGTLDFTDVQSEVNRIHVNFADRHVVKKDITKESFQYWNDLNVELHQMEFYLHHLELQQKEEVYVSRAHFTCTFHNQEKQNLTDAHYEKAVLNKTFGHIYLNYSHVGRYLEEIYWSQNNEIPLEHVQLFRKFSSDFFVYLGPSSGYGYHLYLLNKMKKWFHENEDRFSQIGLTWNPQRLCIGWLSVAYLEERNYSRSEVKAFQQKISRFQRVESIEVI